MKYNIIVTGLAAVMAGIAMLSVYMMLNTGKPTATAVKRLPKGTAATVTVNRSKVISQDSKNNIKVIPIPKFGELKFIVTDKGEVVLKSTGWMPQLGTRPYLGIAYTGKIEPLVGIQVMRLEPIGLGVSFDMTPSLIGISLSKDIFDNTLLGIGTGICSEMTQKYYLFLGVAF